MVDCWHGCVVAGAVLQQEQPRRRRQCSQSLPSHLFRPLLRIIFVLLLFPHQPAAKIDYSLKLDGQIAEFQMYKGNTMRESFSGRYLVRNELSKKDLVYSSGANRLIQKHALTLSRLKYNYTDREEDRAFTGWKKADDLLNVSGIVFLYNYRMHWFKYGWDLQDGVFEPPPEGSNFKMGQLALPGLPAGDVRVDRGKQGRKLWNTYQETVAAVRYLKEVYGYKVILFDGQPGGCESPKDVADDWKATAGHPTCTCNPHSFHIYAEKFVDAVFRQYHCPGLKDLLAPIPLVEVPLGVNWHHTWPKRVWDSKPTIVPASKRKADYAFLGKMKNDPSRLNMHTFVERLAHTTTGCGFLSEHEEGDKICGDAGALKYQDVLLDAVFCPCPRGIKMESFRMTEVIESGCIPIVDDQGTHFEHAWSGIHKFAITTSRKWANETFTGEDLLSHMIRLLNDKEALDKRQAAMMAWYAQHQHDLVQTISDTIDHVMVGKPLPVASTIDYSNRGPQAAVASKSGGRATSVEGYPNPLSPEKYEPQSLIDRKTHGLKSKYSAEKRYTAPATVGKEKRMALIMLTFISIVVLVRTYT